MRRHAGQELGEAFKGPIYLLTHLRYFGHAMNPVSFYYGFDEDNRTLHWILAEITNTPWGERHSYFLPVTPAVGRTASHIFDFAKQFHVSPFLPMALDYLWRFSDPAKNSGVYMEVRKMNEKQFDATLTLHRRQLNPEHCSDSCCAFRRMSAKVAFGIYWHALLALAQTRSVPHTIPRPTMNTSSAIPTCTPRIRPVLQRP